MKTRLLSLICMFLLPGFISAQLPNGNFEAWTNGTPDGWVTNSSPPIILPVQQSMDPHTGTYAVKGEVINYMTVEIAPALYLLSSNGLGAPITQAYTELVGWNKSSFLSTDSAYISITVYAADSTGIGYGAAYIGSSASYSQFTVPIVYFSPDPPAWLNVIIGITDLVSGTPHLGSYFLIDDLELTGNALAVKEVGSPLFSIGPNPVSNEINIEGKFISGDSYSLCMINTTGQVVLQKTIKLESDNMPAIDVSEISEGSYFLMIKGSKNISTQKLLIAR